MKPQLILMTLALLVFSACSPAGGSPDLPAPEALPEATLPAEPKTMPQTEQPARTEPPPSTEPEAAAASRPELKLGVLAYIALDGNVWMADMDSGEQKQVTSDGRSVFAFTQEESFTYEQPAWSSDGQYLAFLQTKYTPRMDSTEVKESLWVYDAVSGETRSLVESENLNGFAWQPGTHRLAYADTIDPNYFSGRGTVEASLAKGILGLDVDTSETSQLVPPQGYALVNPHWSVDGRFISFDEVVFMEGRGNFAYSNIENGEYVRWERAIGNYAWSPDGGTLLYDNLTYIPNGEERIFLNNRLGNEEKALTPREENFYASMPSYSPDGSLAAYRKASLLEEGPSDSLMVLLLSQGGEARSLADLEQIGAILWSADGTSLVAVTGPYDNPRIVRVSLESGEITDLVAGWQPAWQPVPVE